MDPLADLGFDQQAVAARLRNARRARGLTQQDAAVAVGVARTTVVAIEKGERRARPKELVDLARLYDCEVSDLLRPAAGTEPLIFAFRSEPSSPVPHLDAAVSVLQALVEDYLYLEDLAQAPLTTNYPRAQSVDGLDASTAGQELASRERNRLGLGDGPLGAMRDLLEEEVGLRVFVPTLPSHIAGVYAFAPRIGGCIAVNQVHPRERQRWTIAHDYAHFLTERDRPEATLVDGYRRRPKSEQLADAFAGNFLMPAAGLTRRVNDLRRSRGRLTPADILRLADSYGVSLQAMVLRLEDLKLVPNGTLDKLMARGFSPAQGRRLLELSSTGSGLELLPHRYRYLAVELYTKGEISEGQFSRIVRLDRVAARRLAGEVVVGQRMNKDGNVEVADVNWLISEDL